MSLIVCVKSILLLGLVIVNEATDRISVASTSLVNTSRVFKLISVEILLLSRV